MVDRLYYEYPDPARRYATQSAETIKKRLAKVRREMQKALNAHSRAIAATSSMQSQSMRRAHAGNMVEALGKDIIWLEQALQIQQKFPEYSYPNPMPPNKKESFVIEPLDVIHTFETAYPIVREIVERLALNAHKFYQANQIFRREMERIFGPQFPERPAGIPPTERHGPEHEAWQRGGEISRRIDQENEEKGVYDHTPYFTDTFLAYQFYRALDYRYYQRKIEQEGTTC